MSENIFNKILETFEYIGNYIKNNTGSGNGSYLIGSLIPYAGNNVPNGFLLCDGRAISRTEYSNLFSAIGEIYGSGDGSTTFNLPDFRNKVIWGGNSSTVGDIKEPGLPNIEGNIVVRPNQGPISWDGCIVAEEYTLSSRYSPVPNTANTCSKIIIDASLSNPIYGNSDTVQPPAITIQILIKY